MKKTDKTRKTLRLEKEVLVQLDASKLQQAVGGLSFVDACGGGPSVAGACGSAFICGTQVCP